MKRRETMSRLLKATSGIKGQGSGIYILWAIPIMFFLAGCLGDSVQKDIEAACSNKRINVALIVYEDAKEKYMEHMRTRSDGALNLAYHTAEDSIRVALSTKYCTDFSERIKSRATEVIMANKYLQRLAMTTMRDPDPGVAISIFGDKYRDIFKNDIN